VSGSSPFVLTTSLATPVSSSSSSNGPSHYYVDKQGLVASLDNKISGQWSSRQHTGSAGVSPTVDSYKGYGFNAHWCCGMITEIFKIILDFLIETWYLQYPKNLYAENTWYSVIRSCRESIWGPSWSETNVSTTKLCGVFWRSSHDLQLWTWVIYINNVLSIKTILFDILDFWCQLEVIQFVKTLSKRRMFVSFMKISACWLLHRLIKFNKNCWEKRPAKPRPNLRTFFCRRDLKNIQPHLKKWWDLSQIVIYMRFKG